MQAASKLKDHQETAINRNTNKDTHDGTQQEAGHTLFDSAPSTSTPPQLPATGPAGDIDITGGGEASNNGGNDQASPSPDRSPDSDIGDAEANARINAHADSTAAAADHDTDADTSASAKPNTEAIRDAMKATKIRDDVIRDAASRLEGTPPSLETHIAAPAASPKDTSETLDTDARNATSKNHDDTASEDTGDNRDITVTPTTAPTRMMTKDGLISSKKSGGARDLSTDGQDHGRNQDEGDEAKFEGPESEEPKRYRPDSAKGSPFLRVGQQLRSRLITPSGDAAVSLSSDGSILLHKAASSPSKSSSSSPGTTSSPSSVQTTNIIQSDSRKARNALQLRSELIARDVESALENAGKGSHNGKKNIVKKSLRALSFFNVPRRLRERRALKHMGEVAMTIDDRGQIVSI